MPHLHQPGGLVVRCIVCGWAGLLLQLHGFRRHRQHIQRLRPLLLALRRPARRLRGQL